MMLEFRGNGGQSILQFLRVRDWVQMVIPQPVVRYGYFVQLQKGNLK